MTAICLQRPYNGIGDWLMALACLKYVNRQRPEVDVTVDYASCRNLPALVPQAFAASDVRFTAGPPPAGAKRTTDSLVYRKLPPLNYLDSMVHHLNDQTGLAIEYEHGVYPAFGQPRRNGGYVVMVSQGKRRDRHRKEWGCINLAALAQIVAAAGYEVRQIGGKWDTPLPIASTRLRGCHFNQVLEQLAGARAFIGLENGIMVLAGYLGLPQATIYDGHSIPERTDFLNHFKLAERIEPGAAGEQILGWLRQC